MHQSEQSFCSSQAISHAHGHQGAPRVQVIQQPVVLLAAHGEIVIVCQMHHVGRAEVHRVVQHVGAAALVVGDRVAVSVGLELAALGM